MSKFLVLYRATTSAAEQMASMTPEQSQEGMAAWMGWAQRTGGAMVDLGAPVGPAVEADDDEVETGVCGFSILQGDSKDDVLALMENHPHTQVPGASIEVHEFLAVPGM
jgi:hypothetical protein